MSCDLITRLPNEIRDADLLAELARHAGLISYGEQRRILEQRQQDRDRLALLPPGARARARARLVLTSTAPSVDDLRWLHSGVATCGLPYRRTPLSQREFERRQGRMSLAVEAGKLVDPATGDRIPQPLPFGPKARLLMIHLCSEAIRCKSPTIEIADNLTAFLREMGFEATGGKRGTLQAFKEQINALSAARMSIAVWDGQKARQRHVQPFSEIDIWLPLNPAERMLWPTTITFGLDFFQSLQRHALPLNTHALRAFASSARKLDLYMWLNYRLSTAREPVAISWSALTQQFGEGYTRPRDFMAAFAADLAHIKDVFPRLPATLSDRGLLVLPGDPAMLALPVAKGRAARAVA